MPIGTRIWYEAKYEIVPADWYTGTRVIKKNGESVSYVNSKIFKRSDDEAKFEARTTNSWEGMRINKLISLEQVTETRREISLD